MKNLPGSRLNQVHCLLVRLECRGGFLDGSAGKESTCSVGDTEDSDSVPGSGRSLGGSNGHPLQYSYLENPMDRGAWGLQSLRSQRVRHDWGAKGTCTHTHTHTLRVQRSYPHPHLFPSTYTELCFSSYYVYSVLPRSWLLMSKTKENTIRTHHWNIYISHNPEGKHFYRK